MPGWLEPRDFVGQERTTYCVLLDKSAPHQSTVYTAISRLHRPWGSATALLFVCSFIHWVCIWS